MLDLEIDERWHPEFKLAVMSLRDAAIREEVVLTKIPSPKDLADHSITFTCDIDQSHSSQKIDRGTGRFVLLWHNHAQDNWTTNFRVICFAKSPLETDIGFTDDSSELAWAWLRQALFNRGARFDAEAGTTTRVISVGHGLIASQKQHAELELRASWCPEDTNVGAHFQAWQDLICMMSGYALEAENVARIDQRG
jgi:hypothetical protein